MSTTATLPLAGESALILGAGELGMGVLRSLARRIGSSSACGLTVLLRPSTISSTDPAKQREVDELRGLGVDLLPGDVAAGSVAGFRGHHTEIRCRGWGGTKLTNALEQSLADKPEVPSSHSGGPGFGVSFVPELTKLNSRAKGLSYCKSIARRVLRQSQSKASYAANWRRRETNPRPL